MRENEKRRGRREEMNEAEREVKKKQKNINSGKKRGDAITEREERGGKGDATKGWMREKPSFDREI